MKPKSLWRLIDTGALSAPQNMALDEALLRSFDPVSSHPVLRLYGWIPAAISLGRFQKAKEVLDLDRCRADGVTVVRRVTGGGMIFHADEITYSLVCAPRQIPPVSSIKDSFRVLTGFLLDFYRRLGLDAHYAVDATSGSVRLGERTAFCFAGKETFDILVNGRKIGGNAQRRLKGVIFQHGSIPLINRTGDGIRYLREHPANLEGMVTNLADEGLCPDVDRLMGILKDAFAAHLGIGFDEGGFSAEEQEIAQHLLHEKYTKEAWNREGVGE